MSSKSKYVTVEQPPCDSHGGSRDTNGLNGMDPAVSPTASSAAHPPILTAAQKKELEGYDFSFYNIAFEGGGNKGLSATGAIRVLEELGHFGNIKRFAGSSAGSMLATLLSIGYNSHEIETFLSGDMKEIFLDARFGVLSLLPNMLMSFGWHPGNNIYNWFGDKIKEKMGNPDLTFEELYKRTGNELCITATNMNSMDCAYCHVKTTPDMPIRQAVRMSACIPGVFCPVMQKTGVNTDYFVDGGLLCNYPIHCYDGWFLSMDHKDTFLQRLVRLEDLSKLWDASERFGETNDKTFGILMYASGEREVMRDDLMERFDTRIKPSEKQTFPDTTLARKRAEIHDKKLAETTKHRKLVASLSRFLKLLKDCDIDHSGTISLDEFETAMNQTNSELTDEDKKRLFGDNFKDSKSVFKKLDVKADGQITFRELMYFAETQGLQMMEQFRGYSRQVINSLTGYFSCLMDSLLLNMKRIFVQSTDVKRTIGIDTGYLDTLDFKMEKPDQKYLVQQGKLGCIAFLRELIAEGRMVRKT